MTWIRRIRPAHTRAHALPRTLPAVVALALGALTLGFAPAAFATTAPAAASSTTATPSAAAASTLDDLAEAKGRYFGSATDNPELSDTPYTSILGSEFGQITPGNSMKWDTIEPSQGQFNFTKGDAVVDFAQQHNEIVRGHNLVWHSQLPGWVSSLPSSQVQAAMENHITTEATHYKGKVFAWDVVNEPFNDDGTYRTDAFYNAMGKDYIADAFRTAHAADPNAKLYINDYNIEGSGAKADAMYSLVSELVSEGVPINGVGFQGHLAVQYGFPSGMQANMQRFASLGLDVSITELDVRMELPADSSKVATQQSYYKQAVDACLGITRCVGITIWDYTDKYSWVPNTFSGQGSACLWDENLQTKAAYNTVYTELGGSSGGTGDTQAPTVPQSLKVTATTGNSVSLSWTASTDDTAVTGYDVYRGSSLAGSTSSTSFTDSGLAASTTYSYTVKAHDAAGNVSAASSAVSATTGTSSGSGNGTVKVQYKNADTSATDSQIKPTIQLVNTGSSAISLSGVTVRYYFTSDGGASTFTTNCDYAVLGCATLTQSVSTASGTNADHYLQVAFGSGTLAAGASTGDIQLRLNKTDWSNFSETNDYSYGTNTSYADAPKITAYSGGTLVFGTTP